jgi:alkylation response protein AidB-like acyl-CoA dehydrogenase
MDRTLFGSHLRLARERRRLTLRDLEARTKLHVSLFESLEDGTCHGWPVGVYSRSHVRTYAELVGLDGNEVVEEFSTLFPHLAWSEQDQAPEVVAALRPTAAARARVGVPIAPLRLTLAEQPAPYWRVLLTRFAWFLHRLANGPAPTTLALSEPAHSGEDDAQGETALVPFGGLQVD